MYVPKPCNYDGAGLDGVIYGAMPTGMESTIKLRIGDFLLTGVVFGNTAYKIGQEVKFEIGGEDILLFDRKSENSLQPADCRYSHKNTGDSTSEKTYRKMRPNVSLPIRFCCNRTKIRI